MSELPDLSYCKFGRKEGQMPPKKESSPHMKFEEIGKDPDTISPITRQTTPLQKHGIPEATKTLIMEDPDHYDDWEPEQQQRHHSQNVPYETMESMRMPRQQPLDSAWETSTARSLTVMNEVMSTIAAITDGGEDPHEHMVQQILARFATKLAQQKTQTRIQQQIGRAHV